MKKIELNSDRFDSAQRMVKENIEKIIPGYNNLQQLSWLREGLRLAQTVGRIVTSDALGTGWLISDELILTNNHVISSLPDKGKCWIEFNYETNWKGEPHVVDRYEIKELLKTSETLDYSILRIQGRPGEKFGFNNILDARRPSLDSSATHYPVIVQHPRGQFKQIALTDNELVTMDDTYVWYTTDTEPGSSGSPVYDQLWRPFALHHAGGPKKLNNGSIVILNEGIILERIVADASEVLGRMPEHLRSVMSDLLQSGCFVSGELSVDWYINNPRLHKAIKLEAKGDDEIAPLIAAAAGVAAGAAAAHWGHVTKNETHIEKIFMRVGNQISVVIPVNETYTQAAVFELIYTDLMTKLPQLTTISIERPDLELAPLAAAFIAGVAAGAAAYNSGKM